MEKKMETSVGFRVGTKEWNRTWKLLSRVRRGLQQGSIPSFLANQRPVLYSREYRNIIPERFTA